MSILAEILCAGFLLSGAFFVVVGAVGIFRLPDFYTRLHGGGVTDTLGAGLILVGLMFQSGLSLDSVKLMMVLVFLLVTGPTSCHALAQAARASGLEPAGLSASSDAANETNS